MKRALRICLRSTALSLMFYAGMRSAGLTNWPRVGVFIGVYFVVEVALTLADYIGVTHGKGKR